MWRSGTVWLAIVDGAGAFETTRVEEIEQVAWEETMPERLRGRRVEDLGSLAVGIDSHGNSA